MDLFEIATREKYRFTTSRGLLTAEQLWDVPLRSKDGFNLNEVARAEAAELKATEAKEDFVDGGTNTSAHKAAEVRLAVVKRVIEVKLEVEKAMKSRAEHKLERERLLRILAEKQEGALSQLSIDELTAKIKALGDE